MKFDHKILQEYVSAGKLMCQRHPRLPLTLFKYTLETQYSKAWDSITSRCRGLVVDDDGNVVANCIPKFFNIEEHTVDQIPNLPYEIFDKLDGSCVQVFLYNGTVVVTTLGSFSSDQSKIAEKLLWDSHKYNSNLKFLKEGFTYIFELIVPENRIVLDYGQDEKLVLLTIRNNETDEEHLEQIGFPVVEKIAKSLDEILVEKARPDFTNKEGFVVKFSNNFRVKVKYEEYFRLHKIMTGVNPRLVWEYLKKGDAVPLDNVPDEFFQYVDGIETDLTNKYAKIAVQAVDDFDSIYVEGMSKKDFALKAVEFKTRAILFKMYDKKPYSDIIWDMIYPDGETAHFNSLQKLINADA